MADLSSKTTGESSISGAHSGPSTDGPDGAVEVAASTRSSQLSRLASSTPVYMGGALLIMVVFFSIMRPNGFATWANVQNILLDAAELVVLGAGTTYVMVAGGLDLSIASVLVFASVVSGKAMLWLGGDGVSVAIFGLLVAVIAGGVWGFINGLLITKARVPALITTLGTLGAALGLALVLSGGTNVPSVPESVINFGAARLPGGMPLPVVVAGLIAALLGWYLQVSRFGRHTYLIGSNAEAARRAGIRVDRHMLRVYCLSGLCAGFAGLLDLAFYSTTSVEGHSTDILAVIAAVVIGGTSLYGGVGTMIGTMVGVFIPAVLAGGFVILGLEPFWQQVAVGVILILAVYIDQAKRSARQRT